MRQAVFAYIVIRFHMGDTADLGAGAPFWHHVHQPPIVVGWRGDCTEATSLNLLRSKGGGSSVYRR